MSRSIRRLVWAIPVFAAVLFTTGCLSGPFASTQLDEAAKTFTPPDGQANVYIMRDTSWPGYSCQVLMDGSATGWIVASSFEVVAVAPGSHIASCVIFDHTGRAQFFAQAGKNYFFEVVASPGWNTPTVALKESSEESGKALVTKDRRAAD